MTEKSPSATYTSFDEVRDRIAMRQGMTLQQRSRRSAHYSGLRRIIARGEEAAERLAAHGKLNANYDLTPGFNRPIQDDKPKRR
jgi:hypothetical protein